MANPSACWRLKRVLAEFRPDVVHVRLFLSQLSPLILPLLVEVPAIYHVAWYRCICPIGTKMLPNLTSCREPAGTACLRNGCFPAYAWPSAMLQLKLWRHWAHAFNAFVANSAATKRRLEAEGIQPVEVIWNGVPVRPPAAGELSPQANRSFCRTAGLRKRGIDLVEAFANVRSRVPGAKLLIAGDGPERPRLNRQSRPGLAVQRYSARPYFARGNGAAFRRRVGASGAVALGGTVWLNRRGGPDAGNGRHGQQQRRLGRIRAS